MADLLIPVSGVTGTHVFSKDALNDSLQRMLGDLPAGREAGLGFAVDQQGVGVAIMWHTETGSGWQIAGAGAVTRDWSGDVSVGGHITISK